MRKETVYTLTSKDIALSCLLAAELYISLCVIFFTDLSKAVTINIAFRDIYIPLTAWACLALYVFLWSMLCREALPGLIARSIPLGISMHLLTLLYKLNSQLAAGSPLSAIYLWYIKFVTVIGMAALLASSIHVLERITAGHDRRSCFFLPLPLLVVHLLILYLRLDAAMAAAAAVLGLIVYYMTCSKRQFPSAMIKAARWLMSRERTLVAAIFVAAFLLRLFFSIQMLRQTGGGSVFVDGSDDGRTYNFIGWEIAKNTASLFKGGLLPSAYDPGYSLFLALIYRIFGHNFYAVTCIQSLINALVPVAVYYIAKELFSKEVGMLGAVIVSFDQASIMHSVVLGTEALFTVLLAFAVLCVIRYFKDPSKRIYIFFTGALMGLCVITRYTLLLILFFIFITSLFIKGRKFRGKVLDMALITLTALLFISPITAINYSNTGRFYLVEKSEDRLDIVWYNRYTGREEMCPSNLRLVAIGFDPFKKPLDSALLIFKKPVKLIATCAEMWSKRLVNFFFWPNFGFSDPILLVNPSRFPNEFGSTLEFYLFVGYMIGLYKAVRNVRLDRSTLVIFMVFAYFIFIHVILFMFSTVRYRVPVIPCQAVVLAAGIYTVYLFLRRHWGER